MAKAQLPLPWFYPYREDAQSTRLGDPVFRPFVPVSLVYGEQCTWSLTGLIDSGADAILASDLLTEQLGIDLKDNEGHTTHAVGGRVAVARYKTIGLRLHPRDADEQRYVEWQPTIPPWPCRQSRGPKGHGRRRRPHGRRKSPGHGSPAVESGASTQTSKRLWR